MNRNLWKNILLGFILVILLAIQLSNVMAIKSVFPDFMLIFVILFSLHFGDFKGILFGFVVGLLVDMMGGTLFGINAFIFSFLAWFTHFYKKYIQVSDLVAFVVYIAVATVAKYILHAILFGLFYREGLADGIFILKLLGETVYNVIIGAIIYLATPKLFERDKAEF